MDELKKNANWMMAEGVFLALLGIVALAVPQLFSLSLEFFIGILFFLAGIVYVSQAIRNYSLGTYWPYLWNAVFAFLLSALLLFYPLSGLLTLSLVLAVFFLFDGIAKVFQSFQFKEYSGWFWLLLSGLLSLLIAGMIFSGWPGSSALVIGTFIGVSLLVIGFVVFSFGYHFKHAINKSDE